MTSPLTRALALVTKLHHLAYASLPRHAVNEEADRVGNALRSAIRDIGTENGSPPCHDQHDPTGTGEVDVVCDGCDECVDPDEHDWATCVDGLRTHRDRLVDALQVATAALDALKSTAPSPWQPPDTAPNDGEPVRLLLSGQKGELRIIDAKFDEGEWCRVGQLFRVLTPLDRYWTPLAWKPADSTELPANFGEKT